MATFALTVPLRWLDLDAQGHVNNGKVVDLLQEARVDFTWGGPLKHLLGNGIVVVGHQVEYLSAIEFSPRPLDVALRVGAVGAAQFTLGYDVSAGGEAAARARTVCCVYDFEARRPRRLAPEDRAYLTSVREDLPELRPVGDWIVGDAAHTSPVRLRWSDLDSYGHVNNVRFYDFVGEARVRMMADVLEGETIRSAPSGVPDHTWMVARQDLRYSGQLEFRTAPFVVRTAVAGVGRTSLTLAQQFEDPDAGTVFSSSTTVLVHGDPLGRPTPIPDELRAAAVRWRAEPRRRSSR